MIKQFKKILILGNGGSGKSTLARKLNNILAIPVLHLDKIYWTHKELFDKTVTNFIRKERWIIEGTPMQNIDYRIYHADTIIFIDFNKIKCIFRLFKRSFLYLFKAYPYDDGCPAIKLSYKTLLWVWKFDAEKRNTIISLIKKNNKKCFAYFVKSDIDFDKILKDASSGKL